eukprot:gene1570-1596_t
MAPAVPLPECGNTTLSAPRASPGARLFLVVIGGGPPLRSGVRLAGIGRDRHSTTTMVVACHCIACQRRSGSPFGVLAYYPADQVTIAGKAKRFERPSDVGNRFETFFCPHCGSTVYARAGKHPALIGVAVGAIADPHFPAPARSVWEQSKHDWVSMPAEIPHFPRGRD